MHTINTIIIFKTFKDVYKEKYEIFFSYIVILLRVIIQEKPKYYLQMWYYYLCQLSSFVFNPLNRQIFIIIGTNVITDEMTSAHCSKIALVKFQRKNSIVRTHITYQNIKNNKQDNIIYF